MKGINFKEPLFHATIEGRKTQTRRIMNPQPELILNMSMGRAVVGELGYVLGYSTEFPNVIQHYIPRYKVGEVVYLKEPYIKTNLVSGDWGYLYQYGIHEDSRFSYDWKNKLFMPAEAARYFIEITAVRAERLQDISEGDCRKEGISVLDRALQGPRCKDYAALIDKINGEGAWDSNPWVWVYDYKLTEKPSEL